jgi:hypothetical protein
VTDLEYREGTDYPEGGLYEGTWLGDKIEGLGVLVYRDGSIYEGTFENGVPQGTGRRITNDDLEIYTGDFVNGARHGKGCVRTHEGVIADCEWQNNMKHG